MYRSAGGRLSLERSPGLNRRGGGVEATGTPADSVLHTDVTHRHTATHRHTITHRHTATHTATHNYTQTHSYTQTQLHTDTQ